MAQKESKLWLTVNEILKSFFSLLLASPLFPLSLSPLISIEGAELKTAGEFSYIGSLEKEINTGICNASQALGHLRACVLI